MRDPDIGLVLAFTGTGRFSKEWEHLSGGQGHLSQGNGSLFHKNGLLFTGTG